MTVQKEVSAFNKEVDVEHFAGISSSLQAAFNQRESSSSINLFKVSIVTCRLSDRSDPDALRGLAKSLVMQRNGYTTTLEGQTLLSGHERVFKQVRAGLV